MHNSVEQHPFIFAFPFPFPPLSLFALRTLRISRYSAWLHREPLHSEPSSVLPLHQGTAADTSSATSCRTKGSEHSKLSTLSPRKSAEWVLNVTTRASYIIYGAQGKCGAPCSHGRGIMYSLLPWCLSGPVTAIFICYLVSRSLGLGILTVSANPHRCLGPHLATQRMLNPDPA